MFNVIEKKDIPAEVLTHSEDIFKAALEGGAGYYHVTGAPYGDYDIEYIKNNDILPENYRKIKKDVDVYPSYLTYDSQSEPDLELSLLKEHRTILFEKLNEYTVVLARLALLHTEAVVYFHDCMILNFINKSDRLIISEQFPSEASDEGGILHVVDEFVSGALEADFHRISAMPLFHSVFFWQSLTDKNLKDIRYAEVAVTKSVGIGGVLSYYANAKQLFEQRGWGVYLKKNASRYSDEMLEKYFALKYKPEDANEDNTVFIQDLTTISLTYLSSKTSTEIDESVLSDDFRNNLDEYARSILGGHNVLGVLIRGTDYIVANMSGSRKMATVDDMLPMIREWIDEDGYDKIFLATEDQDILERMRNEFGSMIIAISQIRHRVSDFVNVRLISDLEKQETSEEEYDAVIEDNTVNYFYALYLLSRCQSLMVSGQCHGWTVARSFNHGKYKRAYKFQVGIDKK